MKCPDCNSKLIDADNYKLECPKGCYQALEAGQWEDLIEENAEVV